MVIKENKVVSVSYELRLKSQEGDVVEKTSPEKPLTFIYGSGMMLKKFESNLSNLKMGDKFDFQLACEDAYGAFNEQAIVDMPIENFSVNGEIRHDLLQIGRAIPVQDQSGNRFQGIVKEVAEKSVKLDFNHPLAGENLFFSGEVVEIREATPEEIERGDIERQHDCGCGGSHEDCGDGCNEDCSDGCSC